MKNRLFISLGLAAALMTAGCAGKNAGQAQPEEAPAAETVQTTENTENAENAGTQDESIEAEPITDNTDGSTEEVPVEAEDVNEAAAPVDYSDENNWAYYGIGEDKDVDLFLVCPTVDTLDEENMSLENDVMKGYFEGALNMERGIYEDSCRMYAPYYRQMAMNGYSLEDAEETERRLAFAYKDVSDAFAYYIENENDGRPIILAGFSQGADMCYRLMEEYFGDKELQDQLVAIPQVRRHIPSTLSTGRQTGRLRISPRISAPASPNTAERLRARQPAFADAISMKSEGL